MKGRPRGDGPFAFHEPAQRLPTAKGLQKPKASVRRHKSTREGLDLTAEDDEDEESDGIAPPSIAPVLQTKGKKRPHAYEWIYSQAGLAASAAEVFDLLCIVT